MVQENQQEISLTMTETHVLPQQKHPPMMEPAAVKSALQYLSPPNSNKIKEKIIEFNNNVSNVLKNGYVEIAKICSRVREKMSEAERREHELYMGDGLLAHEISCEYDKEKETLKKDDNIKETIVKKTKVNDNNVTDYFMKTVLNGSLEEVLYCKEPGKENQEKPTDAEDVVVRNKAEEIARKIDNLKKSLGTKSTLAQRRVEMQEKMMNCNILAEKLHFEEDMDENLRHLSLTSISTNSLEEYERICQEQLLAAPKDMLENLSGKPLTEALNQKEHATKNFIEKLLHLTGKERRKKEQRTEEASTEDVTTPIERIQHVAEKIREQKRSKGETRMESTPITTLKKYNNRCEFLQENLKIITQDICDTFSDISTESAEKENLDLEDEESSALDSLGALMSFNEIEGSVADPVTGRFYF